MSSANHSVLSQYYLDKTLARHCLGTRQVGTRPIPQLNSIQTGDKHAIGIPNKTHAQKDPSEEKERLAHRGGVA